jgi:hypothetical protein
MKANSVSTRVAKVVLALVAAVVLIVSAPLTSQAGMTGGKHVASLPESQVSINYIGTNENSVIFSVKFENPTAARFWLIIKNDAGEIVYRQPFSDTNFSRAIYLEKGDSQIHPTFIIRKGNEESVQSFAVRLSTTEQVSVTKL